MDSLTQSDVGERRLGRLSTICVMMFLGLGGLIGVGALLIPDYLYPGPGTVTVRVLVISDFVAPLYVLWRRGIEPWQEKALSYVAVANVLVATLCVREPVGAHLIPILFLLPGMFAALFLALREMSVVLAVIILVTVGLMLRAGDSWDAALVHAGIVVVAAVGPSVLVGVLRMQLTSALNRMRVQAVTDPLTGLANRRGMHERAADLVGTAAGSGHSLGLLCVDIDHFKSVNDTFGHAVGDGVIRAVADRISSCVRPGDLVVRMGGEEIAVLAELDPGNLLQLAERIRTTVADGVVVGELARPITISVGVAWSVPDPEAVARPADFVDRLSDEADAHLYEAKRNGRNQVRHQPI